MIELVAIAPLLPIIAVITALFLRAVDRDEHELAKRAEPYNLRTVPRGGLVLVAGVDVQERRFEVVVDRPRPDDEPRCPRPGPPPARRRYRRLDHRGMLA